LDLRVSHLHHRALAELLLDRRQRQIERLLALLVVPLFLLAIHLCFHRHDRLLWGEDTLRPGRPLSK
ncbi:MAG: hypothetical protein AAB368_04270, partial [bacterium]